MIFWPIYQLAQILELNPEFYVIIAQIVLATVTIYVFYLFIKIISDKTIAFYSAIIISFLPIFWISNVTIMMETAYVAFLIFTLYFLAKYSVSPDQTNHRYYLVLMVLSFSISFLTHLGIILWIPFLIYVSFNIFNKGDKPGLSTRFKPGLNKNIIISITISILIASFVNGYLISNSNPLQGILTLYTAKLGERAFFNFDIQSIFVYTRNFIIPLLRNFTILVTVLGFTSLMLLFFKNRKFFILSSFWIFPSLIANQWWDSVFFGRHALIAGFGLAFLTSYLVKNSKPAILVIIFYLFITVFPAIYLINNNIPYLQLSKSAETLPKNGLYIESHFARPQVDYKYKGDIIFADEPGFDKEKLKSSIHNMLENKKPVFVSSQALSEPYGLYSGPYLHVLSLSYKKEFVLKPIIEQFTLKEFKEINRKDNLLIYQVVSDEPSFYPKVKNLKNHRRRIDYFDPLLVFYNKLDIFRLP